MITAATRLAAIEAAHAAKDAVFADPTSTLAERDAALRPCWRAQEPLAQHRERARKALAASKRNAQPQFKRGHVSRDAVIARDGLACHLCGSDVDPANWHLEHVIPIALGGTDCLANAAVAHPTCNLQKSDSWAGSLDAARLDSAYVAYRKAHGKAFSGPVRALAVSV